jgi:EAL domain-containing protein (putative c-di-GMP-specific phosphodiesterase class I)/CheY-like chemotaxis protein
MAMRLGTEARSVTAIDEFLLQIETWQPDIICLDLVMPGMDGIEVLRLLGERHFRPQVIITSGVESRILQAAERSAQAHGVKLVGTLPKPYTTRELRQVLARATGQTAPDTEQAPRLMAAVREVSVDDLQQALAQCELKLAYQPKVSCRNGEVVGFEALARWHHPVLGHISPDVFIALAERNGLIDALTLQVTDQALTWLAGFTQYWTGHETAQEYLANAQISLNVSALSLGNEMLFARIVERCHELGVAPQRVILEVTETSAMQDGTTALDNLTRLRLQGFHLSIDDFGTGYSSMVQLVRLPFSELKIDKNFVMTAATSEESQAVIRFMVNLGRSLGLTTTAEGVEDESAFSFLKRVGCDRVQGYWISRPLAPDAVIPWCLAQGRLD